MVDIKIVDEKGEEVKPTEPQSMESKQIEGPFMPEIEMRAIGDVMGLEKESEVGQYKDKINTLLQYAKSQTEDHSPENLKWVIRSLELKLGTPPFAEKRINWVSRYAYLMMEGKKIDKEKEMFIK